MDTTQPPEKNRGGRPKGAVNKATRDVRELAQQYTAEALTTLAAIMREGNNEQARIAAAKELLDRGHGKSTQPIDATLAGKDGGPVRVDLYLPDNGRTAKRDG